MHSTIRQRECCFQSAELSWLDACEDRQVLHLCGMQASSDNAQSIIEITVNEVSMHTMTPNWCAVLSCKVDQGKSRDVQCLGTCTPSESCKLPQQHNSGGKSFAKSREEVTKSEQPIQLYPELRWYWTG